MHTYIGRGLNVLLEHRGVLANGCDNAVVVVESVSANVHSRLGAIADQVHLVVEGHQSDMAAWVALTVKKSK
jgi:hypothetical protein